MLWDNLAPTNAPVRFPQTPTGPAGPAPKLGEHTREVLAEAGYDAAGIAALIASSSGALPSSASRCGRSLPSNRRPCSTAIRASRN